MADYDPVEGRNKGISVNGTQLALPDQLLWHHSIKSEKTILSDNGEISNWWFVFSGIVCSGHKIACKK